MKATVQLYVAQELENQAAEAGEEVKINPNSVIKPLHKLVSEHKDVTKIVIQLSGILATIKPDVQILLDSFKNYSELWSEVWQCSVFYDKLVY